MNFGATPPSPVPPQAGAAPVPPSDPAGAPAPHPAEAKVLALERQLAEATKSAKLAEALDQKLALIAETDPAAYRYIVGRLQGAPGVAETPAPPAEPQAARPPEAAGQDPLAAQAAPSALPAEVQQALALIPQLQENQRILMAEIAGLRERNLRSDVDTQAEQFEKMILDSGGTKEDAAEALAQARALIKQSPGLVKTPNVLMTLGLAMDHGAAQKRAVAKAQAEEQARRARISGYRGLPGGRSLTSEAGATQPKPKTTLEALHRAVGNLANGTPAGV